MQFFSSAVNTLRTLVVALGAGLGVWGIVNLLEGYGSDNPGAKHHGLKVTVMITVLRRVPYHARRKITGIEVY